MANQAKIKEESGAPKGRYNLALLILGWGIFGITALGVVAIIYSAQYSKEDDVFNSVKDVLAILIPVISAWVGTVLAFYFSRENFETASDKSRELYQQFSSSREKLQSILARDVMINIKDSDFFTIDKKPDQVLLKKDLKTNYLDKYRRNRLPMLDKKMVVRYMVHRSIIDQFIDQKADEGAERDKLTLQDMLDTREFKEMITDSFRAIKESSNLFEAKEHIETVPNCLDVFVTETGELTSPVKGWITNVIVTKHSNI